ncbi:hypothetical protein APHAL10511_001806 [Amanita phalloides]|nr:hypothetical protein APHAL10511_001806 [Amanita phalloides]
MVSRPAQLYRSILRELRKSAVTPGKKNQGVIVHLRSIVDQCRKSGDTQGIQDLEGTVLFLRSQKEHKALLHRYNPSFDYTSEERIKATANRVGLDMPVAPKLETKR